MATPIKTHLLKGKLRLLERGLISEALDLELHLETTEFDTDTFDESVGTGISRYVSDCEAGLEESERGRPVKSKHCTNLKQQFINEFFSSAKSTKCPHCKAPARRIRQDHQNKVVLLGLSSKQSNQWAAAVAKEKPFDLSLLDNNNEEHDTALLGDAESADVARLATKDRILNALQARSHLRCLWTRQDSVMEGLFSCLKGQVAVKEDQFFPTDMFFLDVVAVPPSRFRPVSLGMRGLFIIIIIIII